MEWLPIAFSSFATGCAVTTTPAEFPQDEAEVTPAPIEEIVEEVAEGEEESRLIAGTFSGLELRNLGPALMSGRVADIAVHPEDASTWYVAVGSGNVWKTTNAGSTWTPIFEDQGSYSIGCVTIDANRPATIWVGTGENVGGRHVGYGDGIYRSDDGGASWERKGLEESEHLSKIVVDPRDSNVVYAAAQGPLWSPGGERGLYKTFDGGESWLNVLAGGEYTGVTDVVIDPSNPDVLYAATWHHYRNVAALIDGGPESGIHKSIDGGDTWTKLTGGLPQGDLGKIGLAISPQDPDVVYATIELANREGGFYRSANGGASWEKRNDYLSGGTGPHYYQELYASPHAFDTVFQADVSLRITEDGGANFRAVGEEDKHVDNHAVAFSPDDPDYLLVGCDGGLYESWDFGAHWKFIANLPVTQFYKIALDDDAPFYNVYGGTQDNSTQGGPIRTDNANGIRNADWFITLFADGHQPAVEPGNPDIVYSEFQQGNLYRTDRRTGELVYIQPQPERGEIQDRFNWDAPILISPHLPTRLYYGSQRVWRSDDRGDSWRAISGDLSFGLDRLQAPMMGRTQSVDAIWDLGAMSEFGTVTSLAESPVVEGLLYAGTDDGRIQVSENGGESWRAIDSLPDVADGFFVNDLKADLFAADTVYVAVDQHKTGDFAPYLFTSTDRGVTWTSIVGDLPERHLVWRLVQDHVRPELLFLATEFGIYFTIDDGTKWVELTGGVPQISFRDLAIQRRENDLVGASFGRGIFVLDDYSALREISEEALAAEASLFPVRKAWWYHPRRPLGGGGKASQGAGYFVAPNPPFGAVFTYYLAEELESRKAQRRASERELGEENADIPFPGWDALKEEAREEDPAIVLTVTDLQGNVVRRVTGPTGAGFHRVAWDLCYPSLAPWSRGGDQEERRGGRNDRGMLAAPGTYHVQLAKRIDGVLVSLGDPETFEVVPLREGTLAGASPAEVAAFYRELESTQRSARGASAAIADALERVRAIREVLARTNSADPMLDAQARTFETRLLDLQELLQGNRRKRSRSVREAVTISGRLDVAVSGTRASTYGPTPTHRHCLDIARAQLHDLKGELDAIILTELPNFGSRLDQAGVPWTPGRSILDPDGDV